MFALGMRCLRDCQGIGSALEDVLHHIHGLQKEPWHSRGTDLNVTEFRIAIG